MNKKIAVFGLGNVGLVCALCLSKNNDVVGIEIVEEKVLMLRQKKSYILEAGLDDLLYEAHTNSFFSTDFNDAIDCSTIVICVGTPSTSSGTVTLEQVTQTAHELASLLRTKNLFRHIILRSTVPPQTTRNHFIPLLEDISGKKHGEDFVVSYNPEFLREGNAINDWLNPSIVVVGTSDGLPINFECSIYNNKNIEWSSYEEAEMIKYLSNSYHALKVAFSNEVGAIAYQYGVDNSKLFDLFFKDTKLNISSHYLTPGMSYGGPCLTKDVKAIKELSQKVNVDTPLLSSLIESNNMHSDRYASLIEQGGYKRIIFTGVCFKKGTNDYRESPILKIIEKLINSPSYLKKDITVLERPIVIDQLQELINVNFILDIDLNNSDFDLVVVGSYFDHSILESFDKNVHILNLGHYSSNSFDGHHLLRVV